MPIAIAIDGPAASGKSTVARRLASKLGFLYVNSGAIYRAVTWALLQRGVPVDSAEAVAGAVREIAIECGAESGGSIVRIDGANPDTHLDSEEVNRSVSVVSAFPEVRKVVMEKLLAYRGQGDVVMEGRDIGSVVIPDTPYKFFIDASQEVRDRRRRGQGLQDRISERDRRDRSRAASPLVIAEDAQVIDSSDLTIDQVLEEILARLGAKGLEVGTSPA